MGQQGFYRNRQLAYDWLKASFPLVFGRDTPLKAGIHRDILALELPDKPAKTYLRHALAVHVNRAAYLKRLKRGVVRIDLSGNECGQVVTQEEADKAIEKIKTLHEHFKKKRLKEAGVDFSAETEAKSRVDAQGRVVLSLKKKRGEEVN